VDVFRRMGNELLILGAPGSGKTITLLELARDLMAQAQPILRSQSRWCSTLLRGQKSIQKN